LSKAQIFENVYNKPHANVYLASFMKFYSNHKEHAFIQETVYNGMYKFLETHVCCFDNHKNIPVNFVGSVAYHFEGILKKAANDLGISIRSIIKKPINGLVNYHFKYKKVLEK
jgi:glucosamine kinase